jgi:hypothetical protein
MHIHPPLGDIEVLSISNEVKYAKAFSFWCHSIKEIGSIVLKSGSVSTFRING